MENPINPWMIWGENPLFTETPISPLKKKDGTGRNLAPADYTTQLYRDYNKPFSLTPI